MNRSFQYAKTSTVTITDPNTNPESSIQSDEANRVNSSYQWWFGADITYAFSGSGADMALIYEGFRGSDSNNSDVPLTQFSALSSPFSQTIYDTATGQTNTYYDAVDFVFGQKLTVGKRVSLHPFVGLRYAHINTHDTGNYFVFNDFDNSSQTESGELNNQFNGIGPRFGSDGQINVGKGFSVRGRLGLSALIGSHTLKSDYTTILTTTTGLNPGAYSNQVLLVNESETRVIPEIDARLGLNYTYAFQSKNALGLEAGWQAVNYFNVISDQIGNFSNEETSTSNLYQRNSNFGLQGPYARIQLDIA